MPYTNNINYKCKYNHLDYIQKIQYFNENNLMIHCIKFHYGGGVRSISYFNRNKQLHKEDGPAAITYSITGEIKNKYYHLNGNSIKVYSNEELIKYIKLQNIK